MLSVPRARMSHATPLILCAFLLLLAGVVSGCGSLPFGLSPTPTPDAATILQRSGKASYRDATFTLTMTSALLGSTSNITGNGAITTSPARTHFTISYPFDFSTFLLTPTPSATPKATPKATPNATPSPTPIATPTQVTIEIITDTATNTTYTRISGFPGIDGISLGDGQWIKTTVSGDVPTGSPVDTSSITGLTNLSKVKTAHLIGVETLDGVKVYHLQATVTTTTTIAGTSISTTTMTDYYVRQDNYRPVKIVANTSGSGLGSTSGSTTTLTFTAYDTGVTIDLPQV